MKRSLGLLSGILVIMILALQVFAISKTVPVTSIKLDKSSLSFNVGESGSLKVTFSPANTTQKLLVYSTDNKAVATVSDQGIVTGTGEGSTVITVTSSSNKNVVAKCNVTVQRTGWRPTKEVDISFADWHGGPQNDFEKAWSNIVNGYKKVQPNVKVNMIQIPASGGDSQIRTWITMQLAGGIAPQVFMSKITWAAEDYAKGQVIQLNPYLCQKSPYIDSPTWKDSFSKTIVDQLDGATPGNYTSIAPFVIIPKIYYNMDLFAQAGIKGPPKDWNEFIRDQKLLQTKGIVPFVMPNSQPGDNTYNWLERLLMCQVTEQIIPKLDVNKSGTVELNEIARGIDKGIINLEKSPWKDIFPIIKDWSQYWSQGYNGIDAKSANDMFMQGKAAMDFQLPAFMKTMKDAGVTFNYATFSLPALTSVNNPYASGKVYEMGGIISEVICIPTTAKGDQLKAAVDFAQYLTSPDSAKSFVDDFLNIPTLAIKISNKMDGWMPKGQLQKLNLYGPITDKQLFEDSCRLGQLYLNNKISLDDYMSQLNNTLRGAAQRIEDVNKWSSANNYGGLPN